MQYDRAGKEEEMGLGLRSSIDHTEIGPGAGTVTWQASSRDMYWGDDEWRLRFSFLLICHVQGFMVFLLKHFSLGPTLRPGRVMVLMRVFGTNATPPASQDGVFNCSKQFLLTVDSGAPSRMASSSIVHCQLEFQGTVENRSLLASGAAFDISGVGRQLVYLPG